MFAIRKCIALLIAAVVVVGGLATGGAMLNTTANHAPQGYTVDLLSGQNYSSNQPVTLRFDVDKDGQVFKNFEVDDTKLMHFIVVRKDRMYFQHVHPSFNPDTGLWTMSNLRFPTDGQYRLFALFIPEGAPMDAMGMAKPQFPYSDVTVGNVTKADSQSLGADNYTSTVNGITASITRLPVYSGPSAVVQPKFYVGEDSIVYVELTKDNKLFKNSQHYLGMLGHMTVLGPNLQFMHTHPMSNDLRNQTGYLPVMVTFPVSGQYKIYLETKADGAVNTFSFTVSARNIVNSHGIPN